MQPVSFCQMIWFLFRQLILVRYVTSKKNTETTDTLLEKQKLFLIKRKMKKQADTYPLPSLPNKAMRKKNLKAEIPV